MSTRIKNPAVFKENGAKQRSGVKLSIAIVNALVQRVLSGQTLFPPGGLEIAGLDEEDNLKPLKIGAGTLNSWITRGNIIPETGEPLKAILDKARREYRVNQTLKKQEELVAKSEEQLCRVLRLSTRVPLRSIRGEVVKDESGSTVYRQDIKLINAQVEIAKYITERLDPQNYGKSKACPPQQGMFSLAELRRAKIEENQ